MSCGRLRVARRRVFGGGEQEVEAGGRGVSVSCVNKMRKNSKRTLYARPVSPPAPCRRRFRRLVPSWSPTVAACCGVRVVDEWNCQKWKSTLVGASRMSRDLTRRAKQNGKLG